MFLIDDLLLFPFRTIVWIFREVEHAAQQELSSEADSITDELRDLYMLLETGRISEKDFQDREKLLLDRLDSLKGTEEAEGRDLEEESEGGDENSEG